MKTTQFRGRTRIDIELLPEAMQFSTEIKLSLEQVTVIREKNLAESLELFIITLCSRHSYGKMILDPIRILFTEGTRLNVNGIKILIRLSFATANDSQIEVGVPYARFIKALTFINNAVRDEIHARTGIPFVNRSTSSRRRVGKSGESIASLKKERDRAKRELDNLKRLINFGENRRSSRKTSKGSD